MLAVSCKIIDLHGFFSFVDRSSLWILCHCGPMTSSVHDLSGMFHISEITLSIHQFIVCYLQKYREMICASGN